MNFQLTLIDINTDTKSVGIGRVTINWKDYNLFYVQWKDYYQEVEILFINVYTKYHGRRTKTLPSNRREEGRDVC